jgi:hypothetical protein
MSEDRCGWSSSTEPGPDATEAHPFLQECASVSLLCVPLAAVRLATKA